MINGAHAILYSDDANATRAALAKVLGTRSVDAGGGWRRRPDPPAPLRRLAAVGLLAAGSITIARIVTRSGRN